MTFITSKIKLLPFTRVRTPAPHYYNTGSTIVKICSSYICLGVHHSTDLSSNSHMPAILTKANRSRPTLADPRDQSPHP